MSRAVRLGLRLAWRVVPRVPEPAARALFGVAADLAWRRRGRGVRQLEANLARVRPEADAAELRRRSRAGMRSYLRYWCDVFALPSWSRERVVDGVRFERADRLRAALDAGRGAVVFLGHCGNWDHLGAWAAAELGPVTTVAERLEPPEVFDAFVAFRTSLGVDVVPHAGGGGPAELLRALRAGHLVPLVADRDLTGRGVEVSLFGEPARVAGGPAALALAAGAPLLTVTCHVERAPGVPRWRLAHVLVAEAHEVAVPDAAAVGGRDGQVRAMTQACVDHLARDIAEHPSEWHMLQKVFVADLATP